MNLLGRKGLLEFVACHPDLRPQVAAWVKEVEEAHWRGPLDVRARYASASFLGDQRVIFNLKGNKYRVDTKITYEQQIVLVKRIGTTREYSKWNF